uniref:Uncharacterized protein n=1 Tax=Passalora fulva TaxID=5499 RepID=A0A9Q8PC99_PASFU
MPAFRWLFTLPSKNTTKVTLCLKNPKFDAELRLDEFNIDGVAYTRKNAVQQLKKGRTKISPIWAYREALVRNSDLREVYYCYNCELENRPQSLPMMNGNQGPLVHLQSH